MCIYTQYYTVEKPSDRRTNRRTSVWVALVHSPSQRLGILESRIYIYANCELSNFRQQCRSQCSTKTYAHRLIQISNKLRKYTQISTWTHISYEDSSRYRLDGGESHASKPIPGFFIYPEENHPLHHISPFSTVTPPPGPGPEGSFLNHPVFLMSERMSLR